jgi:hypothetical protein
MIDKERGTLTSCHGIFDQVCEDNRYRDEEIMRYVDGEKRHAKEVLVWVEKLDPKASAPLKIAALFHDVDRIITPGAAGGFRGDRKSRDYIDNKKLHAKRSADYTCQILIRNEVFNEIVDRVKFLIAHHDDVGEEIEKLRDKDLDCLVTADCLSLFTSFAPKIHEEEGEERLRDKIRFMIDKVPSHLRKKIREQRLENIIFETMKNQIIDEFEVK